MPPQEPQNPQPTPQEPIPQPIPLSPPTVGGLQQPPVDSIPQPLSYSTQKKKFFSKKLIIILIIVLSVLVLFAGIIVAIAANKKIKLVNCQSSGAEILCPEGYEKNGSNEMVEFTEPGDTKDSNKSTRSAIMLFGDSFGSDESSISDEQQGMILKYAEESLSKSLGDNVGADGQEFTDKKTENITHNGNKAVKITGSVKEEGVKVGEFHFVIAVNSKSYYAGAVLVHKSDPGLKKQVDKILGSLKSKG